jgi:hypothetical protein
VASALSLISLDAAAFCRTTTCDPAATPCEEMPGNPGCVGQGVPLSWPIRCIGVALQEDASKQVNYEEFDRVARAAFDAWNTVDCGGQPPSIQVQVLGSTPCGAQEFNRNRGNANVLVFREDAWPYQGQSSVLALTTLTFGVESGTIYDADLEINAVPSRVTLTTSDKGVKIDLESILAHEAGHLLGLAHSSVQGATMTPVYQPGTISFRDLHPDDAEGLCAAYPPGRAGLPACDFSGPTPESQGFSRVCGGTDRQAPSEGEEPEGCGCSEAGRKGGSGWVLGLLLPIFLRRRRRLFHDAAPGDGSDGPIEGFIVPGFLGEPADGGLLELAENLVFAASGEAVGGEVALEGGVAPEASDEGGVVGACEAVGLEEGRILRAAALGPLPVLGLEFAVLSVELLRGGAGEVGLVLGDERDIDFLLAPRCPPSGGRKPPPLSAVLPGEQEERGGNPDEHEQRDPPGHRLGSGARGGGLLLLLGRFVCLLLLLSLVGGGLLLADGRAGGPPVGQVIVEFFFAWLAWRAGHGAAAYLILSKNKTREGAVSRCTWYPGQILPPNPRAKR